MGGPGRGDAAGQAGRLPGPEPDAGRDRGKAPRITLLDTLHFYDTNVFNQCEQMGCVMETLDIWKDVHPSIVIIPMEWDYRMPYGIVYAKRSSEAVRAFIRVIQEHLNAGRQ